MTSSKADTTRRPWRRTRRWSVIVAAALVAAACGSGDDSDESVSSDGAAETIDGDNAEPSSEATTAGNGSDDPARGGSISVGLEAETDSWLPGEGQYSFSGQSVAMAIYDPLLKRDVNGEIRPYLAAGIEVNDDLTEWTLTLRPDVTFHDGTPLNADAVVRMFEDYLSTETSNLGGDGQMGQVDHVEIVDELTVTYVLSEPNAAFSDVLSGPAGYAFSPDAADAAGPDAGAQPVGTGPFVFESWQRDSQLTVVRNEDYWQPGLPYLDSITFRPIPDVESRLQSLIAGDVQVLSSLTADTAARVAELDGVTDHVHIGNSTGGVILNTLNPPFDDVRVRKALAHAVDVDAIIEVSGAAGIVEPATQTYGPSDPYYSTEAAELYPTYDPEQAEEHLAEYVNDPDRSDGKAVGEPVSFRYDCVTDPINREVSQLFQAYWSAVGIDVELREVEQATHIEEARSKDYEAKCYRMGSDDDPYRDLARTFYDSDDPYAYTGFTSDELKSLLDQIRVEPEFEARRELVLETSKIMAEEVPQLVTYNTVSTVTAQDGVSGITDWVFPDGTAGNGAPNTIVMWAFVHTAT